MIENAKSTLRSFKYNNKEKGVSFSSLSVQHSELWLMKYINRKDECCLDWVKHYSMLYTINYESSDKNFSAIVRERIALSVNKFVTKVSIQESVVHSLRINQKKA